MRRLPDLITSLRLIAAPFLVWLIAAGRFRAALLLIVVAGATDWLDGFAARRLQVSGRFGTVLDPLADKVLLVTVFLALAVTRLIPLWLVCLAIGRDLTIVCGALLLRVFRGRQKFSPSLLGKISTFFQIVLVLLVLAAAAFPYQLVRWLELTAIVSSAFFTGLSGIDYVHRGIQMAHEPRAPRV